MGAPPHLALDQSGAFQNLDVLRSRRERDGERLASWPTVRSPDVSSISMRRRVESLSAWKMGQLGGQ